MNEQMSGIAALLSMARCPNGGCDNEGHIAHDTGDGIDYEPCQWCHERDQAVKHMDMTMEDALYGLLVLRGYAQWEATEIAQGPKNYQPGLTPAMRGALAPFLHAAETMRQQEWPPQGAVLRVGLHWIDSDSMQHRSLVGADFAALVDAADGGPKPPSFQQYEIDSYDGTMDPKNGGGWYLADEVDAYFRGVAYGT
jgi:hypothetical protein